MDEATVTSVAQDITEAVLASKQFEPLSESQRSADLADAYRIQSRVYRQLGRAGGLGELGGHKIALTSPAIQELVGLNEPIYGSVFQSQIYASPHVLSLSNYVRLGLEFEVAVRLAVDVPAGFEPYDSNTIAPFVQSVMPAFELIEDRAADYQHLDAFSLIADRCWCAGTIIGAPVSNIADIDLSSCECQMLVNGSVVERANTGLAMGHPFHGLAWVANFLNSNGRRLRAGDVVITGSALKTYFVQPGDQVSYQIEGLGEVSVSVSA